MPRFPLRWPTATAVAAVLVLANLTMAPSGCATSPEIEEAPLAESRQKKLRKTMVGTWEHVYVVAEGGEREPVEEATVEWTFRQDGSGTYRQQSDEGKTETERAFRWRLEGRNIVLERENSSTTTYYRAETWSPKQMRWHNYAGGETYVLRRR